uniref:Uncharacterized protein n=1 Tax=Pectobacterium carotovorum TaxID=554 RepID=A0A0N9NLK5_PECCA|nr:Hypothetical protein [Pectobacterium carotovorum]
MCLTVGLSLHLRMFYHILSLIFIKPPREHTVNLPHGLSSFVYTLKVSGGVAVGSSATYIRDNCLDRSHTPNWELSTADYKKWR